MVSDMCRLSSAHLEEGSMVGDGIVLDGELSTMMILLLLLFGSNPMLVLKW